MPKTSQTEWMYCRDSDGTLWIINEEEKNVYKDTEKGLWRTRGMTGWFRVNRTTHLIVPTNAMSRYFAQIIDLTDIPEPAWEDERPIIVTLKTVSSVDYYHYN